MIKRTVRYLFPVITALFLVSNSISAHHGVAHYDMQKTIVLAGTMTAFNWGNPHCLVHMDVSDDAGRVQHWTLEMASTSAMSRKGWTKYTLKQGDQLIAETHPARNAVPLGISATPEFILKIAVNGRNLSPR
jgi:uncharacterized protein DUF6152